MLTLLAGLRVRFTKPLLFPHFYIALVISTLLLISGCNNFDDDQSANASRKVPQSLIASSGARTVVLEWGGVADASSYTIYWSNNPGVKRDNSEAIQTTIPRYEHLALANGSDYYYVVSSHTGAGESSLSNEVHGRPQLAAPIKPDNLRLKADDRRITVDFDADASVTGYQLLWATDIDKLSLANLDNAGRINNITPPFVHTDLDNTLTYFYRLHASNADGNSTDSEIFQASPELALPLTPVISHAIANSGQVIIHWSNHSNAESFDLFWSTSPNVTTNAASLTQVNSPFTHAPLAQIAGQNYYYRIRAHNQAGYSALSNELHVTTPDVISIAAAGEPPAPPTGTKIGIAANQLTLDWQPATGSESLGYNLYWQLGSAVFDDTTVIDKNNNSGVITNIKPPYTHIGLQNNVYYYYRLSAINHAGESALTPATPIINARPEAIVPGVPSGVAVLSGDQSLTVRWNPVDRADSYTLTINGLSSGTTTVPNVTSPHSLDNLNLVNGTTYTISLQSVSAAKLSAASTEVQATPNVALPNPPTQLVAIPNNGNVLLQWRSAISQASIDPAQGLVSGYKVYWSNNAGVTPDNGTLYDTDIPLEVSADNWQVNVSGLNNGRRHYFIVTAINAGGESAASLAAWALPQVPAPAAPTQVYAEAGDKQVSIHFQPAIDVTGTPSYNLYWSKEIDNKRTPTRIITNIPQSPTYVFTDGESNGITYYFQVSATNAGGESVFSTEISATPQIPAPQVAPSNVSVVNASGQIDLSWDGLASASEYLVFWSTGTNIDPDTSAVLYAGNALTLTHPDLVNGRSYFYRVAARNAGGMGPVSTIVVGLPQVDPPATPSTFATVAGNAQVTLNWAADNSTINPASSYVLQWRYLNDTTWSYIPGVASGYVHTNLNNLKTYEYQLIAQNAGGNSAPTAIQAAAPQQPPTAIPTGLSVAAGDQQNSIRWFTQPNIAYKLYWSTGTTEPIAGGQFFDLVSPTFIHGSATPLTNGEIYHYKIVANFVDANNNSFASDPSVQVSATPNIISSGAPTGLSAQAGDQQVILNWFAPTDAQATTTYTLYWGTQAGVVPSTPINNVQLPYVHTGRTNAQDYYYRITATTNSVESSASNIASATPMPALPSAPLGVAVTSANGSNIVSWLTVTAASTYSVESSVSGAFDDTQSSNVTAPITQFTHTGLSNGQTVFYRIVAVNSNSDRSGYSSIVSGTPQAEVIPSNSRPSASNVSISDNNNGNLTIGTTLTGHYTYSDVDGDLEGASTFQWYRDGSAISAATTLSYTLTPADSGTTIRVDVTPIAIAGANPGSAASASIGVGNSVPFLSAVNITDTNGAPVVVGDTLIAGYTYNDIDGDLEGTSTYQWFRGATAIATATTINYDLVAADADQSIRVDITPVAASGASPGLVVSATVLVTNSAPAASGVSITDNNAGAVLVDDILTGNYTYSDIDNDLEGATGFQWFRNNTAISGATAQDYTVTSADSGQAIRFDVTPVAQTGTSPGVVASATLLVGNSAPSASNVSIVTNNGSALLVGDVVTVSYTYNDVDGDTEGSSLFQWYRNGTSIPSATNSDYTVVNTDSGQLLRVEVTPIASAGSNPGTTVSSLDVTVDNSPPTIISATLNDANGGQLVVGDFVEASYNYTDVDGDAPDTAILQWFADDVVIASASSSSYQVTAQDSGKTIRFEVTPVALTGVLTGAPFPSTNTLVVSNSAPLASTVTITDDNAGGFLRVGDNISSSYVYSDADNDLEGISLYQWFADGTVISGANGASFIPTNAQAGQAIHLEVTPVALTGVLVGAPVASASLTVFNSVPQALLVSITDSNGGSVLVDDVLVGTYTYFDNDGDLEGSSTYQWFRGTSPISGATAIDYTTTIADTNQSVRFEVIPAAATGASPGVAASSALLSVGNSAPVASAVSVFDSTGGPVLVNEALTPSYTYFDADGDPEGATTYQWYRNGIPMSGENGFFYRTAPSDDGQRIRVDVTPIASAGTNPGLTVSSPEVLVENSPPLIAGVNIIDASGGDILVGDSLNTTYLYTDVDGDTIGTPLFQWFSNDIEIPTANQQTFIVTAAQAGLPLRVEVTPVALTGVLVGIAASSPSLPVVNSPPVASNVRITNGATAAVNDVLQGAYDYSDIDGDTQGATTFQWFRAGTAIGTATALTYTTSDADVGQPITFAVTPVAAAGTNPGLTVTSAPTTISAPAVSQNLLGTSSGMLVSVDSLTGNVTPRSGFGLAGFRAITEIGYDYNDKLIYGINELPKVDFSSALQFTQIVSINPATFAKQVVGYPGAIFLDSVGIAVESNSKVIYSLNANGDFYSYDLATKTTSPVTNIGFNNVKGLAIDILGGGTLYTIQTSSNQLIAITPAGIGNAVAALSSDLIVPEPKLSTPHSLSFDPNSGQIIAAVPTTPFATEYIELMSINKTTGQATNLGGFHSEGNVNTTVAFAYDPLVAANNTVYFAPRGNGIGSGVLHKINLPAYGGQKISRIPIPFRNLRAVVVDRNNGTIYGIDENSKYVMQYSAGVMSIPAQVNIPGAVLSLAMDPTKPTTIYAASRSDLYTIDTTSWAVTHVGAFLANVKDMAFNPSNGTLYGIDYASSSTGLMTINTSTGAASLPVAITGTSSSRPIMGIGFSQPTAGVFQLHGISNGRRIYSINPSTGIATNIDTSKIFNINHYNITFDGNNLIAAFNTSIKSVDITNLAGTNYVEVEIVEHTYPAAVATLAFDNSTNTAYAVSNGTIRNLYKIDTNTGLSQKIGNLLSTFTTIAFNPTNNQLYGLSGTRLYSIRTSGAAPLDSFVGTIANVYSIHDIAFDANGTLYGIVGFLGLSVLDLASINPSTLIVESTARLPFYSTNTHFAYNASSADFIFVSSGIYNSLARVTGNGVSTKIGEIRSNSLAYQNATDTIFRFPDSESFGINSSKTDLSTLPVMSMGKLFTKAIAHDSTSDTLYMVNNDTGNLLRVDKNTGQPQIVGQTQFEEITGLVFDPLAPVGQQLIGFDGLAYQFLNIDPATGRATVRPGPELYIRDLAIDTPVGATSSTIYANANAGAGINGVHTVDLGTNSLNPIITYTDAISGAAFNNINGITIDSAGNMYGVTQREGSDFYIVNIVKETGVVTHTLKKTSAQIRFVLTMDKSTNTIYGFDQGPYQLVSVDPLTGNTTTRGALGGYLNRLVYSASNNTFYGIQASNNRYLYTVDPVTGNSTFINGYQTNSIPAFEGLAVNPNSLIFYSTDNLFPRSLSTFDTTTSLSLTPINFVEEPSISVTDLEWNSSTNTLFGLSKTTKRLFQFSNLTTATGAFVGAAAIGTGNYDSLVYSPANNAFFTIENETDLLMIDATTGATMGSRVPLTGDLPAVNALTFQP